MRKESVKNHGKSIRSKLLTPTRNSQLGRHWILTSSATISVTTAKESLRPFARYVRFLVKKTVFDMI